jgi:hypothetical protein
MIGARRQAKPGQAGPYAARARRRPSKEAMTPANLTKIIAALLAGAGTSAPALAGQHEADVLHCTFKDGFQFFIATAGDNSARIGVQPGIGDKGVTVYDPANNRARVVIEFNGVDMPVTMTSIQGDGVAVHSRQSIGIDGKLIAPSQQTGQCDPWSAR